MRERGFGACGACRVPRRGLPAIVRATRLRKGQVISVIEEGLMSLKWHDKRDVTMLSTIHDASMVTKSRRSRGAEGGVEDIQKPSIVDKYNLHMGGVDLSKPGM